MKAYPYFFEWVVRSENAPTSERVLHLSGDRPEYEMQFAALLAMSED